MRLTYETGTATIIQLIVLAFLNIANMIYSIVSTCSHPGGDCVGNTLTSIVYYILIVIWFITIAGLGYMAQTKRSRRLTKILILAELAVFVVASYNIRLGIEYHNGALSSFTSLVDVILAVWIITLAFRLLKAKGGRVVTRRRHHNLSSSE